MQDQYPSSRSTIVYCGHVCLDLIPGMANDQPPLYGGLIQLGPAEFSTGGSVSNTGLGLHKLGIEVRLSGRIGDDVFGREICRLYEDVVQGLSTHLQVISGEPSS